MSSAGEKFRIGSQGRTLKEKLRDLFFGMFYYGMHQQIMHTAQKYRDIVYVLIMGEALGMPILGNYYTLRLIPYIVGDFIKIKELVAREVDVLELMHEGHAVH